MERPHGAHGFWQTFYAHVSAAFKVGEGVDTAADTWKIPGRYASYDIQRFKVRRLEDLRRIEANAVANLRDDVSESILWERQMRQVLILMALVVVILMPRGVQAQSTIAGLVTDASGAVVPGVTVAVASPALIERVRESTTDVQGRYAIVDLRPGAYAVTVSLAGFKTVSLEGIQVASNVTVPVNVRLELGTLNETLTVTSATPMVDVQRAARTEVLTKTVLDELPTSRNYLAVGTIVAGVKVTKPDMGGTNGTEQAVISARGKQVDQGGLEIDGMDARSNSGGQTVPNFGMLQEVTYQTSAASAEQQTSFRINMIPRDGGNRFAGDVFLSGTTHQMQSNNITPDLVSKGLPTPTAIDKAYDFNPGFGGPILKNGLWFYGSVRRNLLNGRPAGAFYADGTAAIEDAWVGNASVRLTWQATPRNKFTGYYDRAYKFKGHDFSTLPAEATPGGLDPATGTQRRDPKLYAVSQGKWTAVVTPRVMATAGVSMEQHIFTIDYQPGIEKVPFTPEWYANAAKLDFVRGTLTTAATGAAINYTRSVAYMPSTSLTYVTGSHEFKTGIQGRFGPSDARNSANADLIERFRGGVPDAVDVLSTPTSTSVSREEWGVYAQDSWSFKRLTVNPGLRFEYQAFTINPTEAGAGRFVSARSVLEAMPIAPQHDVAPRLSMVYDVFGNARTAIKFSVGKYMEALQASYMSPYIPISVQTDRRNWSDCDLTPGTSVCSTRVVSTNGDGIAQDGEIGPSNIRGFGSVTPRRPDNLQRVYSWEYTVSLQHQLFPRLSLLGAWYHSDFRRVESLQNVAVGVSDFTSFQVANPLGNGETITIFNLKPEKQGLVDNVVHNSDINKRIYDGFELSASGRLPKGGTILGSWAVDRNQTISCDTNNPNQFRFCDQTGKTYQEFGAVSQIPYRHEFKLSAAVLLPWDLSAGMSIISFPGAGVLGSAISTPAQSLGVNWTPAASLFPGGRTQSVTLPLIPPGTKFLKRWNSVDATVKRIVRISQVEIQPTVEVFNLLNSSVVLSENQTFGPALGTPSVTMPGRLLKLSVRMKF